MINPKPIFPETWKIYYTTTDNATVVLNYTTAQYFGANVLSNTYDATSGGCIAFDGEVTKICGDYNDDMPSFGYKGEEYVYTLQSITIPSSVTEIGYGAFEYNYSLTGVSIPDSVNSFGECPFWDCTSLPVDSDGVRYTSLNASDNPYLVGYTDNFTASSYSILNGTKWIGTEAFNSCTSLSSVTIPNSVISIGEDVFSGCYSLPSDSEGVYYTSLNASDNPYCLGYGDAFTASSYSILNGTKWIGDYCFYYCESLSSITIPDSVTSIGDYCFYYCESLSSITIPDSVTSIGEAAFLYCTNLSSITIPDSVTSIGGGGAFYGCSSLSSITIPNSVTSIGEEAFNSCSSLSAFTGNNSGISSDNRCVGINGVLIGFAQYGLTSYIIPSTYTSIGCGVFANYLSLSSITIPDSVTSIGDEAFYSCTSLNSVTLPSSVTSIGMYAFCDCDLLTSATFNGTLAQFASITKGENWFGNIGVIYCTDGVYTSTRLISTYSDGVKYEDSVSNKTGLLACTLTNCATKITTSEFNGCTSLSSVTIPSSVTSIGNYAFCDCTALTSFTCLATTPPTLGISAFYQVPSNCPIYVPSASVSAYKTATNWSARASYIQAIP